MIEESSLLDDLRAPGTARAVVVALVVLGVGWVAVCVMGAYW